MHKPLPGSTFNPGSLPLDGRGALYTQLTRALKRAILQGRLIAGTPLPPTRALARTLGLSRNTVIAAYDALCAESLTTARGRAGTYVRAQSASTPPATSGAPVEAPSRYAARARTLPAPTLSQDSQRLPLNLKYGQPLLYPELFHSWRRKLAAAALRAAPGYPGTKEGHPTLRHALAEHLAERRGVVCAPDDIIIVTGTQQAITLAARVLIDEGDITAIEEPHYQYLLHALSAHGARVVGVRTDRDGLVVAEVPPRARLICVTPSHQFPSGAVMSPARRIELLEFAARHDSWILEDDYDSELRHDGRPLPALRSLDLSGRVIFAGTFSKTLFPSLRLGYIVCPRGLRMDLWRAKLLDDLSCPELEQVALAAFIQGRQFERHLGRVVKELGLRRQALVESLERHAGEAIEISASHAGTHLVVWLKGLRPRELQPLMEAAAARGLGLHAIHPHYLRPPPRPGLLMGYAGLAPEELRAAAEVFGRCLREVAGPRAR